MKLTNLQLGIVKDMIRDKIKASKEEQRVKEELGLYNSAKFLCEKHPAFKAFTKAIKSLPQEFFFDIAIKDSTFFEITKSDMSAHYTSGHTHVKDTKDFIDNVVRRMPGYKYQRNDEMDTKREIEKKIVMASINAKDLESLIDSISKEFVK